ncbi:MAG: RsmB/NOP family class I SAM-dependent RNA methyltransferase [Chloroflexota bacterium]
MTFETLERYKPIIDDWDAFCDTLNRPLPTTIWTNTLRVSPQTLCDIFVQDGIELEPLTGYASGFTVPFDIKPAHHWSYAAGLFHIQETVSMLPVLALNPQSGDRVLDLCAAPGNKTAQIAVALNNAGTVIANDISYRRMRASRQTLERLGLVNVATTTCDGGNFPQAAGYFDKILVDVPCSAEGTYRKDRKVVRKTKMHKRYREGGVQLALLRKAIALCRPGGRVVYSTCTFAPEENERVVNTILAEFGSEVIRIVPWPISQFQTSPGLTEWQGQTFASALQNTTRIWPHHNDTGGFFIAVLEKKAVNSVSVNDVLVSSAQNPNDYATRFTPIEPEIMATVTTRFGLPTDYFSAYHVFQRNQDRAYIVNQDHHPPPTPEIEAAGVTLIKTGIRYPKLTTAGTRLLGQTAKQNYIDLTAEQVDSYFGRQTFAVPKSQCQHCTSLGYVLIRFNGYALGIGFYRPDENDGTASVTSLFPKGWSAKAP